MRPKAASKTRFELIFTNTNRRGRPVKLKSKHLLGGALLGLSAAVVAPAQANDTVKQLLTIMHENGQITDEQFEILMQGAAQPAPAANIDEQVAKAVEEKTKNLPKVTMKGKFKVESQDGQHSFQPIGRIFWDYNSADDDGVSEVVDGGELRRARLGFQAQFFKNWKAKLEYDFGGGDADLKDGWISYNSKIANGDKYSLKFGQHHVPFGFNTISSSKYMSFLRRPLFADGPLSPARQVGAAFRLDGDRYLVHAGLFIPEQDGGETDVNHDDTRTYAVRVAGTPVKVDKNHLLHIGGSYMHIDQNDNTLRVRQRAVTHLDDRLFNTGQMMVDSVNAFDLEFLGIYGSAHVLGEYVYWDLDQQTAGAADSLSAWSIEAGYFLTGESMKYKKGQFSGVSPKSPFMKGSGIGAWQAVVRYETMDLNDGNTFGGDGDVISVGLNWTPVKNVRFMATWNKLLDFETATDLGAEPSNFGLRAMVYW